RARLANSLCDSLLCLSYPSSQNRNPAYNPPRLNERPAGWHLRSGPDRTPPRDHHGLSNRRHTHVTNRSHAERGPRPCVFGADRVRPSEGPICRHLSTCGVVLHSAARRDLLQPISGLCAPGYGPILLPPASVVHVVLPAVVLGVVLHAVGELLRAAGVHTLGELLHATRLCLLLHAVGELLHAAGFIRYSDGRDNHS